MKYQYIKDNATGEIRTDYIKKIDDSEDLIFVPTEPDNTDYQAYLAWCKEGNTPLPADEVTQ